MWEDREKMTGLKMKPANKRAGRNYFRKEHYPSPPKGKKGGVDFIEVTPKGSKKIKTVGLNR